MRSLKDILPHLNSSILGNTDMHRKIHALQFDSRKVEEKDVFFALKGELADGHEYIEQSIEKGALAVVCEDLPEKLNPTVTYIHVQDTHKALGEFAALYYGNPSRKIKLIGVTGTNGKTTIATLLHELFISLGYKVGLLSTIENKIQKQAIPSTHTTPDIISINELLSEMINRQCEYCFMEVSSHAVVQKRIEGLVFHGGVFTNITHEHLDYHKNFSNYIKAKKLFFDQLPQASFALSNSDDKNGRVMLQNTFASEHTYGLTKHADFSCRVIENSFLGLVLQINEKQLFTHLLGQFNVYNILAIYAVARLCNQDEDAVLQAISDLKPVEGRFEVLHQNKIGIVDYAHTPDALKNILKSIRDIRKASQNIITVVGAGGNRDKTKRPLMAEIACRYSDKVILTSDNPRFENPEDIIKDMQKGVGVEDPTKVFSVEDRKEAIHIACVMANKDDIILVAGKGHEKYQEIKGVKRHFDDKEILNQYLS